MRENLEREREGGRNRKGYIHNVDQSSISFFVTNFPEDCNTEDLWKAFGRFGRLGDVYIPNKVDKWGKRFAFVKFREDRDVMELCNNMDDVWISSFKLRVNKSRFGRKDDEGKKEEPAKQKNLLIEGGSFNQNRSFKAALENDTQAQSNGDLEVKKLEEVYSVKVDEGVLKELQESYVGRLGVNVEVYRIRTILFMEGLAHISVTDMGGMMVLIHSPKKGEIAKMWKDKMEWISYYFREVIPWMPNCFSDRRETWVKVYGVPLHVWGENLFKVIGGKYGEFLDFDNNTAARVKLNVACIKISTDFRGVIDDPMFVRAMGVTYKLRIMEEKVIDQCYYQGERWEEQECSWVASVNIPGEGRRLGGVGEGSQIEGDVVVLSPDDGSDGGFDEGVVREVEYVVTQSGLHQMHGDGAANDGDRSVMGIVNRQNQSPMSDGISNDQLGKLRQSEALVGVLISEAVENNGAQGEKLVVTDRGEGFEDVGESLIATCQEERGADLLGGSMERGRALIVGQVRPALSEPILSCGKTRSTSLTPNRVTGHALVLGRKLQVEMDFNDSISLIEVIGGVASNIDFPPHNKPVPKEEMRRRSRKPKDK
jgi:hypothetical protein